MSNSASYNDFYQVPDLTFDISKLRADLEKILKKSKYQTLGITNFAASLILPIKDFCFQV
tara:strand:+ start:3167 stop:3346 length:180 start_codon:yes stop_codon:yes gene_type:complete